MKTTPSISSWRPIDNADISNAVPWVDSIRVTEPSTASGRDCVVSLVRAYWWLVSIPQPLRLLRKLHRVGHVE